MLGVLVFVGYTCVISLFVLQAQCRVRRGFDKTSPMVRFVQSAREQSELDAIQLIFYAAPNLSNLVRI